MNKVLRAYLKALTAAQFTGEVCLDIASRAVMATDDSVYQIMPQAVIYPKSKQDIITLFQLSHQPAFRTLQFAARGGGTGTNGQSLTSGIIINFARYMQKILALDLTNQTVTVQPGVVLDQLNDYLRPMGYFFAATVSTSDRATLGGMISTDASGKGSCLYGKTSQHIQQLECVLNDGTELLARKIKISHIEQVYQDKPRVIDLCKSIVQLCQAQAQIIQQQYPDLLRYMTGYDLKHVVSDDEIDLAALIAGSEGSLANITAATLKITPIPGAKVVLLLKHTTFAQALQAATWLNATKPAAVEIVDETVMQFASQTGKFSQLKPYLLDTQGALPGAISLVEYVDTSDAALRQKLQVIGQALRDKPDVANLGFYLAYTPTVMKSLWQLRKESVELLGKTSGRRRPVSGIEDTVVAPEKLQAYIAALKQILDKHELKYAMYGHADAGCVHVRPALDLLDPKDQALYYELSNEVAALVQQYGGLIWGEHGKGLRSQYIEQFVGEALYYSFRQVKQWFDPFNQLNPGKIATPLASNATLLPITTTKRVDFERKIHPVEQQVYAGALHCNGNAACFNYHPDVNICPSYKVTRDPIHSPKGRASILKEWLYLQTQSSKTNLQAAEQQAYRALEGCLGCKACVTQCPVSVNIPQMKASFYEVYFRRHWRNVRQYCLSHSEQINRYLAKSPVLVNRVLQTPVMKKILRKVGMVDLPVFANPNFAVLCQQHHWPLLSRQDVKAHLFANNSVALIIDWPTLCYEPRLIGIFMQLLQKCCFQVHLVADIHNGKLWYNQGMLTRFKQLAAENLTYLHEIDEKGLPIIGIEPSMTLAFREEYLAAASQSKPVSVQLIQEFLLKHLPHTVAMKRCDGLPFYLLSHCSEKTNAQDVTHQWVEIFKAFGLELILVNVGCCGMAGSYGHETQHYENSLALFALSWRDAMDKYQLQHNNMLVTGFSCREQVFRVCGFKPLHPVEVLLNCGYNFAL